MTNIDFDIESQSDVAKAAFISKIRFLFKVMRAGTLGDEKDTEN